MRKDVIMRRRRPVARVLVVSLLASVLGCAKDNTGNGTSNPGGDIPDSSRTAATSADREGNAEPARSAEDPAVGPSALDVWQQGDKSEAIRLFVNAKWQGGGRPFASDSVMSLSEKEFQALAHEARATKAAELNAQVASLRELLRAVAEAGSSAAAQGNTAQARQYFEAIKEFGTALNSSEYTTTIMLLGKNSAQHADSELQKLPK